MLVVLRPIFSDSRQSFDEKRMPGAYAGEEEISCFSVDFLNDGTWESSVQNTDWV